MVQAPPCPSAHMGPLPGPSSPCGWDLQSLPGRCWQPAQPGPLTAPCATTCRVPGWEQRYQGSQARGWGSGRGGVRWQQGPDDQGYGPLPERSVRPLLLQGVVARKGCWPPGRRRAPRLRGGAQTGTARGQEWVVWCLLAVRMGVVDSRTGEEGPTTVCRGRREPGCLRR